jgi:hypothetical protein
MAKHVFTGRRLKVMRLLIWEETRTCSLRPIESVVFDFYTSCLTICLIQIFYINIIYFVMTYFIIRDILIIIYLLYICIKNLNKTNGQIRSLQVKNDTFNGTEGVYSWILR